MTNHALKVSSVSDFATRNIGVTSVVNGPVEAERSFARSFCVLEKGVIQNNSVIAVNNITWLIKMFFSGVAGTASLSVRGAYPIMTSWAHHNKLDGAVPPNDVYHLMCRCRDLITFPSLGVKLSIYPWAGLTRWCLVRLWVHNAWKDIYRGRSITSWQDRRVSFLHPAQTLFSFKPIKDFDKNTPFIIHRNGVGLVM